MQFSNVLITSAAYTLCTQLLQENPQLAKILSESKNCIQFKQYIQDWALAMLESSASAKDYYTHPIPSLYAKLQWKDYAIIRILDYLEYSHELRKKEPEEYSDPFQLLWYAVKFGTGGANKDFFEDMRELFRQLHSPSENMPKISRIILLEWMERHPSGLDPNIIEIRKKNRDRILRKIVQIIESSAIQDRRFHFEVNLTATQKWDQALVWWNDPLFHLRFAVRQVEQLNHLLDDSLPPNILKTLYQAQEKGIPFFINPYYLSLIHVNVPPELIGTDQTIRDYMFYSQELVDTFGHIVAWEREDKVEPNRPNIAGWILPPNNTIHRRYPDVAILIPDGLGRTCGGLCSCCQRMYEFQQGSMNFHLEKNRSNQVTWPEKLKLSLEYFEHDTQLRDILITGGDALMLSDKSLETLLTSVLMMAETKKKANVFRPEGRKYAEMVRVRLGTRLPIYLPQRITPQLSKILSEFREKAQKIGIQQCIVQTHFASSMEITPEAKQAISQLIASGWLVSNQHVLTISASRRGHNAKLRQVLNQIGVVPYYTFTVKGYAENRHHFTPNARSLQEQQEEKIFGQVPEKYYHALQQFPIKATQIVSEIANIIVEENLPFLATDRNVLNLPGVGKSMAFRVIGITYRGQRILEFEYDTSRAHSPIIHTLGKIKIIESKSIAEYIRQLKELGEKIEEYADIYGYSIGRTDPRMPVFEYPVYPFSITQEITHFQSPLR